VTSIHFNMLLSIVNPFQRVHMSKLYHQANPSTDSGIFVPFCQDMLSSVTSIHFHMLLSSVNPFQRLRHFALVHSHGAYSHVDSSCLQIRLHLA
jgi:hypothetical protein